jgi:acetyl-CoA carboxylase biotin carboxylase subunit
MQTEKLQFAGSSDHMLAAAFDKPDGGIRATALFAHCFTCSKDTLAARRIAEALVTEERTGKDLVIAQIETAAGRPLAWRQEDVAFTGHVIECRINAEDPSAGFAPAPGTIETWRRPTGEGVRVDTHVEPGYVVPPFYDSLLAKVIVRGVDRGDAIARMVQALSAFTVEGVPTTIPMHLAILQSEAFRSGRYDTRSIPGWPP